MEHQTSGGEGVGCCGVERVADDRMIEAEGRGAMETQLVGATRERMKGEEGAVAVATNDTIARQRCLARLPADHLARTIVGIGTDREVDDTTFGGENALDPREVLLADGVSAEQRLHGRVGIDVLGSHQDTGSGLIETMHHPKEWQLGMLRAEPTLDIEQRLVLGRNREDIVGFVDNDERRVLVDDVDGFMLRHSALGSRNIEHEAEDGATLLDAARIEHTMHTMQLMGTNAGAINHLG